ncbi:hypothetical protein [Peptacetobacter sp. AB800]|uniref:hypothetical protein n=1 Tax=Peptacetobacter sp. AB800 TaxID=3388428 RepID=UPI0039FC260F
MWLINAFYKKNMIDKWYYVYPVNKSYSLKDVRNMLEGGSLENDLRYIFKLSNLRISKIEIWYKNEYGEKLVETINYQ